MNFDLNEEQQMLSESVSRFAERSYPFELRLRRASAENGFSRETWRSFAELGWLGASVPEEFGGLGFSTVESAIIAEELGRALVLEPFLLCSFLPAALLLHCAAEQQKADLLPGLAAADVIYAAALSERNTRGSLSGLQTTAAVARGSYVLHGHKTLVVGAPVADRFIVTARRAGGDREDGVSLFLVDKDAPGVRLEKYSLLDGTPAADLHFEEVEVAAEALLGEEGSAFPGLQQAVDESLVIQCAELLGDMEDAIALTADYVKIRKQFGVPIGSFQAVQHRLADMAIELSQARASLHLGLMALSVSGQNRSEAVSGCKAQVVRSAHFVTTQGIQLHGGYGITEEYKVGHHFRRLMVMNPVLGNGEYHLDRYARSLQSARPDEKYLKGSARP